MPPTTDCAPPARVSSIANARSESKGHNDLANARVHATNRERSSARGIARFLMLGIGYAIVFFGTSVVPGVTLKLMGSWALFLLIFHLALSGHDAGHGSVTRSASWNRWIGRLAFLPSYTPFSSWLASHNALHHAFTNLRDKDPLCAPLSKKEYDALSALQQVLQRFYRTFLGVAFYNMRFAGTNLLFPEASVLAHIPCHTTFKLERGAVLGFLIVQVGATLLWQQLLEQAWGLDGEPFSGLCAAIVVPFVVLNWWTGLMSFLHHTHPHVRWYADLAEWRRAQTGIACTVHLIAPWPLNWLLGNSLEHTAHHVAPKVPGGELSDVQALLEAEFPDIVQKVRLTECWRILAFCKLYDYEQHRWLDYTGKPMPNDIPSVDTSTLGD